MEPPAAEERPGSDQGELAYPPAASEETEPRAYAAPVPFVTELVEPGDKEEALSLSEALPEGLVVLNDGGNDSNQSFLNGAGAPDAKHEHPPVNYHAYAACTAGSFLRDAARIRPAQQSVLLLLRRDLKRCLKTMEALQATGRRVAVSLKESGSHQMAALLNDGPRLALFREICARADACLASTPELIPVYRGAGGRRVEFIPTPYPIDSPAWDFSRPLSERRGIFIGTREFDVLSRNHLAALLAIQSLGVAATVINPDGRKGRRVLASLGFGGLRVVEGRLDYASYLRLMAEHRVVFQLDRSAVPGQVAGDALLCRVPCIGGDGAVERIAFPTLCGYGREANELVEKAAHLLRDDAACLAATEDSQRLAREKLSFTEGAKQLKAFFGSL